MGSSVQLIAISSMTGIEWRESFCTGIAGIDHEHRELVDQLNALILSIEQGENREHILEGLDEVYADIASHFALEEEMMRRHGYDQYRVHAADHHRLLDEIRDINEGFEGDAPVDIDGITRRLSDWFQVHFSTHDARLHQRDFSRPDETVGLMTRLIGRLRTVLRRDGD